jgi:hypothetical protein
MAQSRFTGKKYTTFEAESYGVTLKRGLPAAMGKVCGHFYNESQCPILVTFYYFIHLFTHSLKVIY